MYNTIPVTRDYSKPDELAQTFCRLTWLRVEGFILLSAKEIKTVLKFRVYLARKATTVLLLSPERRTCAPEEDCHKDLEKLEVALMRILQRKRMKKCDYGTKFYVILEIRTGFGLNLKLK